jgi:hypothetical protein
MGPHRYPRLIFKTRHGGVYEGGEWAAFPCHPEEFPPEANGDDIELREWFQSPPFAVGVGDTPDEALAALEKVVNECTHPPDRQHRVPGGSICAFCDELWGEPMTPAETEEWRRRAGETTTSD